MGRFATGVTVVTMKAGDTLWGMTANAVTSLSLDPPLVLVCVDKKTQTHGFLNEAGSFAMNILAEDQQELSNRFATRLQKESETLHAQIHRAHQLTTGRPPTQKELAALENFAQQHGLTNLCRVLFNLSEFTYLD